MKCPAIPAGVQLGGLFHAVLIEAARGLFRRSRVGPASAICDCAYGRFRILIHFIPRNRHGSRIFANRMPKIAAPSTILNVFLSSPASSHGRCCGQGWIRFSVESSVPSASSQ